jgi:hypothetical protein
MMRSTFIARPGALWRALVLMLIIGAAMTPRAIAHFNGQPNSSISSAVGPIGAGVTYSGRFGGSGDVDYYYFVTTRDNVALHFNVRNTLSSCRGGGNCQIYATLVSTAGQQLGGEGSTAGTGPVGYAGSGYSTDTIDWTFGPAGRYILVFDSDGGTPTYQFAIDPSDGVAPGIPAGGLGPLFRSLSVPSPQRTTRVLARLTVLQSGATVRLELRRSVRGRSVVAGRVTRSGLSRGRVTLRVPLNASARAALKSRGRLSLSLRVRVTAAGRAPETALRRLTVR